MKGKTLTNWLCLSGIVSFIFYLLHTVIGAIHYPGYAGTFQNIMHGYVITITVVLLSIVSITLIIVGGLKDHKKYQSLSLWAGITYAKTLESSFY